MANIRNVIPPKIVSEETFANAMNASASYQTNKGRGLTPVEVALLKIAELEKRIAELEAAAK